MTAKNLSGTLHHFNFKATVTESDVACGIQKSCQACPVAQALLRTLPRRFRRWGHVSVNVGDMTVSVIVNTGRRNLRYEAGQPAHVTSFIHAFDDNADCHEPFPPTVPFEVSWDFRLMAAL